MLSGDSVLGMSSEEFNDLVIFYSFCCIFIPTRMMSYTIVITAFCNIFFVTVYREESIDRSFETNIEVIFVSVMCVEDIRNVHHICDIIHDSFLIIIRRKNCLYVPIFSLPRIFSKMTYHM